MRLARELHRPKGTCDCAGILGAVMGGEYGLYLDLRHELVKFALHLDVGELGNYTKG
jgi:hypothetical protein